MRRLTKNGFRASFHKCRRHRGYLRERWRLLTRNRRHRHHFMINNIQEYPR